MRDVIPLGVRRQRSRATVETIGLDDARAVGGGDDARQAGARPSSRIRTPATSRRASHELVREGDRRGPEHDAIRDEPLLLAEIARLVGLTEDGAPVLDAPRMSVEAEMVVVKRLVMDWWEM